MIAGGGASFSSCCCTAYCMARLCHQLLLATAIDYLQLSAMDVSARTTMKGAAKCDKHCDLQNSVNQQGFERILRFRDTPESMPASESILVSCCRRVPQPRAVGRQESVGRVCAPRSSAPLMHAVHTRPPQRRATNGTRNLAACYRCKSSVGLSNVKCYLARAPAPWPLP